MTLRLITLALLVATTGCAAGLPVSQGITNFGKVDERLYRGAQPDAQGLSNLKQLGVKTIINLRLTNDVWNLEASEAQAQGMCYTNIPMNPLTQPTDEQVKRVLSIIESSPGPVFIHCQYGRDRTGTIVSCYRIRQHNWSSEAALNEADQFGMSHWEYGMRRFVAEFGRRQKRTQ